MSQPTDGGTVAVSMRLLRDYAAGEWGRIAAGLVLILAGTLVSLIQPWPLKLIFDNILGGKAGNTWLDRLFQPLVPAQPMAAIAVLCAAMLVIEVIAGLLVVVSTYVLVAIGLRMVFKLRCALFTHMQRLSLRFHDSTTVGDSLYRVTWDSYCVQAIFNTGFIPTLTATVTLAGIGAMMFAYDWMLTAMALAIAVPLALLVKWMDRPMSEHSMRVHERESEISTRVQETLTGIRAVQAFGQEAFETERFRRQAQASLTASLRLTIIQTGSQALVGVLMAAGIVLTVWIGARHVLAGTLTVGAVIMMLEYVRRIFKPLETLAYTASQVQGSVAGARRVYTILDAQPEVTDAPGAVEIARAKGNVRFENVSFFYNEGQDVLKDVSLDLPAGSTVALVGPSGAGKTTLVSLVMRFYDPSRGRVMLDGKNLREITVKSLRKNVSLVLQDPVLFCASIRENISYGLPGATAEQIESAARSAGAHEFITALPQGYETEIGERGVSLSGGQRQRLAIARAFLKDAPILILDEPTSALDAETEAQLLAALDRLKAGRTTIIIAHRLSTIRSADVIIVMKDGNIVETGTHGELLPRNGLYSRLHAVQFNPIATGSSAS